MSLNKFSIFFVITITYYIYQIQANVLIILMILLPISILTPIILLLTPILPFLIIALLISFHKNQFLIEFILKINFYNQIMMMIKKNIYKNKTKK